jgi:hypothetical protein
LKPAAAIASNFSFSAPLRQTVAIALSIFGARGVAFEARNDVDGPSSAAPWQQPTVQTEEHRIATRRAREC